MAADRQDEMPDVDPVEFARAMLHISPDDAAKVRERTPATRKRAAYQDRERGAAAEQEPSDAPTGDPRRPSNPA